MSLHLLRTLAFTVVFGALYAAGHLYAYRRLVRDVTDDARVRWVAARALFAAGAVAVLLGPLLRLAPGSVPHPVAFAVMAWSGVVLYLLFFLLGLDVLRWGARRVRRRTAPAPQPGTAPATPPAATPAAAPAAARGGAPAGGPGGPASPERRRVLAAAGAGVAAGLTSGWGLYRALTPPRVSEVEVRLPGLPASLEGFTLVQLTDVHVGLLVRERHLDMLVEAANALKGDLVAVTGDLVDGSVAALGRHVARLQRLRSRLGTYFVTGNHDYYSDADAWCEALSGLGWTVLRNRAVRLGDAGGALHLAGVDDWSAYRMRRQGFDLDAALAGVPPGGPTVLLAHQPKALAQVARAGVGLQLSGHTHGGQMFPGTLLGRLTWGAQNAGLSRVEGLQVYVSRGCGYVGPPMRVDAPPEVVRVVLLRA
jgi:predicted MPP superfamily phosphohydrolase